MPRIGFGTWQLGGETTHGGRQTGWGHTDEKEALRAIAHGLDCGIRFFDTADSYGKGRSERLLGKALKGKEAIVCTKFGNLEDYTGKAVFDPSPAYMAGAVEASLKRLRRDTLDILLLHSPPDDFDWKNHDTAPYEKLVAEGKIRRYGLSAKTLKGAINALEHGFGSVVEVIYNALDRRAEEQVLPLCAAKNYAFVARVPLASGFLSPKYLNDPVAPFPATDIRAQLPPEVTRWFADSTRKLSFLHELEGGLSVSALRFSISHPQVTVAIPGIRKQEHALAATLAAQLGPLPPAALEEIARAVPTTFPGWL